MLVSGRRGVGKTEFTKKLLKSRLIAPPPECIWCYAKHQQDLFKELMKINVEYVEGIPGELDKYLTKNKKNLFILDNFIDEASKSLKVTPLFTRGRHDNLSVIYITENLFHKNQRTIGLNSTYMMIFKNPRDNSQFATIARQIRPDKVEFLMWSYKDAISFRIRTWCLIWNQTRRKDPQHVYFGRSATCIFNILKGKKNHL